MKSFIEEFKTFAIKGNVVDLAVAVIIGAAFGKIVSSLVNNIVMPLIGLLLGGIEFAGLTVTLGEAIVNYGAFIQSVVDFLIIALVIFVTVKALNHMKKTEEEKPEAEKKIEPTEEVKLLREIRDSLQKGS